MTNQFTGAGYLVIPIVLVIIAFVFIAYTRRRISKLTLL